ncbi:UDP-N-acetylhexosamine pyrophosphorylase-like [Watersipora subatra]|uniref:UDP-N-acetylhexosamine pyrophosphorylase-like n=1 Tax=Watersipora subatra TaxID=2589382 RepID=UPI00355C282F
MVMEDLRARCEAAGQEQLLQFWEDLTAEEKISLEEQINALNLTDINEYYRRTQTIKKGAAVDDQLEPLEPEVCGGTTRTPDHFLELYRNTGLEKIANGEVAVLLLAGGQGTRLGVSYPKGMYNVGLPSRKCLYQLQGERIIRIEQVAAEKYNKHGNVPWYIMTSEATKAKTSEYFQKKSYFGLKKENVIFFEQSTLPCLTFDGKIMLEGKAKIAKAPDGNGGLYRALGSSGVLQDMIGRGIKHIHVYCVDNILIKMADPVFIGFCVTKEVQCGNKSVEKTNPTEPLGVVGKVNGTYQVVEYSEMALKTAQLRTPDGRLKYNSGNIANHYFHIDFLADIVRNHDGELTHHIAKKKIPCVNEVGEPVKPTRPNGIKMEKFVFDVFRFAQRFCCWDVLREDEFSALKNADGAAESTPTTCRHALYALHYKYILNAGGRFSDSTGSVLPEIPGHVSPILDETREKGYMNGSNADEASSSSDEEVKKSLVVEISPLVTYAGEDLEYLVSGNIYAAPLIIAASKESVGQSRIRKPSFIVDK